MSNPQDPYGQGQDPGDYPRDPYAAQPEYGQTQPGYAAGGTAPGYPPDGTAQYQPAHYPQTAYPTGEYPQGGYAAGGYPQAGYGPDGYGYQAPGQPPQGPNRTGLIAAIVVAVVLVIAVVVAAVVLVFRSADGSTSSTGGDTLVTGQPPSPGSCGLPGTGQASAVDDRVASGPLSFPISAAPTWTPASYTVYAESVAAAGLEKSMPDGQPWQAGAEVGQTNFEETLSTDEAAARMLPCIAAGAGFARANPEISNLSQPESVVVDGVPASKVTADILVTAEGVTVPGDAITVIVVDSAPQTYALIIIPIGQDDMAAVGRAIEEQLEVERDV